MKLPLGNALRLAALATGFIVSAFFTLLLISQALSELINGKTEVIPILALMFLSVAGYVVAWFRQKPGGWMMIAGGFAMVVYLLIAGGIGEYKLALTFGLPFVFCGLLFLFSRKV